MEKRAITQSVNPVLPSVGFVPELLLAPRQAIVTFFSHVSLPAPHMETTALDTALGRVLAQPVVADGDYPSAARSAMDGFALSAAATPGEFEIGGEVAMGAPSAAGIAPGFAARIPTGGVLPAGTDAVVPSEDVHADGRRLMVGTTVRCGANVVGRGADMRRDEVAIPAGRRIRAGEIAVLATLGVTSVPVFRRPVLAVMSSGDELIAPQRSPAHGEVRDSNRYAVAASLQGMGAIPRHYPTLRDEPAEFERALGRALEECDGIVVTGGSSVGERDRLRAAVERVARPGVVVHGLRVKPGKPTLLGAHGCKPIIGLPGNPASALMILEAVAAPIVAALAGAPAAAATVAATLDAPASSRIGWTWYVPVTLRDDAGVAVAHPLAVRSFSVRLLARADGYIVMGETDAEWAAGRPVIVHRLGA